MFVNILKQALSFGHNNTGTSKRHNFWQSSNIWLMIITVGFCLEQSHSVTLPRNLILEYNPHHKISPWSVLRSLHVYCIRPIPLTHGMYSHKSHIHDKITQQATWDQKSAFLFPHGLGTRLTKGLYKNVSMWLSTFYGSKADDLLTVWCCHFLYR